MTKRSPTPEESAAGNTLTKSVSKQVSLRELRSLQETIMSYVNDKALDRTRFCFLCRTYIDLRTAIRIEKGLIKPGSRNISVREESSQRPRMERVSRAELDAAAEELGLIKLPKQGKTG